MMRRLLFLFIFSLAFYANAQDTTGLTKQIAKLEGQPPIEKIYLHLAKTVYNFRDTIWYKIYLVVGAHHQLSALSGVSYVELISPADTLVGRQIVHLTSGVGWGDIPLEQELKPGIYRIRSYTNWMRNNGDGAFYEQKICIGGVDPHINDAQTVVANPDVQFFPEGGNMVSGVRCRLAFKAIGANGLGTNVKGIIEDNEGKVVTDFASSHLGMGEFAFTPEAGKSYVAKVFTNAQSFYKVSLPEVADTGFTMTVNNRLKDSIYIKIAVNNKTLISQKNNAFYLIAQSNGKVYYTTQGKLEGLVFTAKVDKGRFPSGIAQITLFDDNGKPIAERIAYVEGADTLQFKVTSNQTENIRKINLQANDENNKPVSGTFSVAVINESLADANENAENTIMNNLLLTSDLKGNIEQPNYYFTNPNDQTRADLDLLMLTQGYRRIIWDNILRDTAKTTKYMPEQSLSIAGTIKTYSGKPVPNGKLTLLDNKENLFRDTVADINGNFRFTNLYLSDTSMVVLKAKKANNSDNVKLQIYRSDYPSINKTSDKFYANSMQNPQAAILYQQYQKQQKDFVANGIRLKEVKITGYKHKEPDLSRSANLNKGSADQVIMGSELGACIRLSDCLAAHVHFADVHNMVVIIDGNITAAGDDYLNAVDPNDIYSIEVLRHANSLSIYGSSLNNKAALVITLKNGSEKRKENYATVVPGLAIVRFNGFAISRTFYSPKYLVNKIDNLQIKPRDLVFWKPNLLTNKDGKATFEYTNNSVKGTYRIVIEGIDDDGNLGRQVYKYEVK